MKTSLLTSELITPEAIALLSRITEKKLDAQVVTPPVLFLAALIAVLMGVMFADQTITDAEKQRWQKTVNRFIPTEGDVRQLTQLLSKGIREQKVYAKVDELITLATPFSESERLLLIGFGYEMACADGSIDEREKQYLQLIANRLGLKSSHLEILEAGLTQGTVSNLSVLEEVRFLLDPARFHELDTLFVSAASDLLEILPIKPSEPEAKQHQAVSYVQLERFQQSRKALDNLCYQVYQIVQECVDRSFLPNSLITDVSKISQKLQSQKFRLAVLGEFSQGKSTLLNALLGEKIQPARTIPCSGTISVLRYGSARRIICHYKDGRQEEISLDQYKEMAAIPKDVARGESLSEALSQTEIQELIFEHPELELCRNGVEILDSPGLNENPRRTEITNQLLEGTDAAIFLANATRPLTQGESELIQKIGAQLNSNFDQPAQNLFVVANFIDLLDDEEDRQDVQQRFASILTGENPLIAGENRIHYISAKAALDALLKNQDNEYLRSFRQFTQAIELFLVNERGALEIERFVQEIQLLNSKILDSLEQGKTACDGGIRLSEQEKQGILEQIGEATGREVKLRILTGQVLDLVLEETEESWNRWIEGLEERLVQRIDKWSSKHSAILNRKQLFNDYVNQFNNDLSKELNGWIEGELKKNILKPHLSLLDEEIKQNIEAIKSSVTEIDKLTQSNSINWVFYNSRNSDPGSSSIFGNLGLAGLGIAAFVPVIILAGPILTVVGSLVAGGFIGTGVGGVIGLDSEVRSKVFEKGCEKFVESLEQTHEKIGEIIGSAFQRRVEEVDQVVTKAISVYETLLEQQEKIHALALEQNKIEKDWIDQKQQDLKNIQKQIEAVLTGL